MRVIEAIERYVPPTHEIIRQSNQEAFPGAIPRGA